MLNDPGLLLEIRYKYGLVHLRFVLFWQIPQCIKQGRLKFQCEFRSIRSILGRPFTDLGQAFSQGEKSNFILVGE